jgi:hypothetical protein
VALKALLACPRAEFSGPVAVTVHYWLKNNQRPDLNNLMAATADILEKAGVIRNDRGRLPHYGNKPESQGGNQNPLNRPGIVVIWELSNDIHV